MVSQVNVKCDFGKGVSEDIYARYGESGRVVSFDFVNSNMDGGVVEISNARFCLVKSDGNFVIQDFDNSVGLDLTSNMCASSGVGSYEVQVNIDGVVVSGRGSFIVSDRVWNDEVIESVSEGNGLVFPDDFQEKLIAGDGIEIEGNVISWNGVVDWTRWYKDMREWREANIVDGVAEFETVEEGLLKELKFEIEPEQDLHGYDRPWIGGAGKNLLPLTVDGIKSANNSYTWTGNSYTINGVTFNILTDSDGNVTGIKANGNATDEITLFIYGQTTSSSGDITFVNDVIASNGYTGSPTTARGVVWGVDGGYIDSAEKTILANSAIYGYGIRIASGYNAQNIIFYPMLRLATETDPTFAPYTNICPISGWNNANVSLKDGDGVNQREYSIDLLQTFYGGVLDVTKGELKISKKLVLIINLAWTYDASSNRFASNSIRDKADSPIRQGYILSDRYKSITDGRPFSEVPNGSIYNVGKSIFIHDDNFTNVNDFISANGDSQILYELKDDIILQLQKQEILALEGVNNISADSGEVVSCVYSKIAKMISARNVYMDDGETVQEAVTDLQ